ncbi:dihydrodipicolinate synthase family protein [Mucilaginibacter pedocola]|uniref:Dihydrodipicolinate synthase family protein n=2 Tax=Mucilaginibacter pedocola TaxID=1792845 RepID=A0A1S9PG07_9SPHI|nr:dihydrodipicolinate synthase family protein [Mucilaginibacter pedocola]
MITTDKKFIPVMLTPFDEKGAIDKDALARLTEYYIQSGAKGLFANCLSSEMYELTPDERVMATRLITQTVNGRVPVVATGIFERDAAANVEFIKRIHDTGVDSVILTTSLLADEEQPDSVLEAAFDEILNRTEGINFGFYECPLPYKRIVSPALLGRLLQWGRVTYFKDTSLNLEQVTEKIAVGEGYQFGLYDAYMVNAVASLRAGAAGLSCIQGNYFPELVAWLCENYNKPRLAPQVLRAQQFFTDNMDIMHDYYPTSAKEMLELRGFAINTFSRKGTPRPSPEDAQKFAQLYRAYREIEEELLLNTVL